MAPTNNLETLAEYAADNLTDSLTTSLRSLSHINGWPSHLIAAMSVDYEDGDLVIHYSEELKEQIENLEYGDINSLPNAVIRPFILRMAPVIGGFMEREVLGAIMIEEGVL